MDDSKVEIVDSGTPSQGPDVFAFVTFWGEVDPNVVTAAMGISPSSSARRGQSRRPGGPPVKDTYWMWQMDTKTTYDGTPALKAMVEKLEQRAGQVDQLRSKSDLKRVVVTLNATVVPDKEAVPSVYLEHQLLSRLAKLNVDVEFDFTLLAPED
jgi:hypothetical protein